MTREEFLQRLSETPRTWRLTPKGMIRNRACGCPVTAVCDPDMNAGDWYPASKQVELDFDFANGVVDAADNSLPGTALLISLRADLLRACGLA